MLELERVTLAEVDWAELDGLPDRVVFQTRPWLEFLARTQGAEPVVAALRDGGGTVGWFTGAVVRKLGLRILGSPFPGWTTAYMGFNLLDGVTRAEAAAVLPRFAFRRLGCVHVELRDRRLTLDDGTRSGYERSASGLTFELDLRPEEDELFSRMTSACRRAVRKSEKDGVAAEEAEPDGFAEDYYAQLEDVFAKQGLTPGYGLDRVRELVTALHPSGKLLLVRARSPAGESIATAIFPTFNGVAYFWGGASWRAHQIMRPNEAVFWFAMRRLRERGVHTIDLAGGGDYKRKYGVTELRVPLFRRSRLPGLGTLRMVAEKVAARGHR